MNKGEKSNETCPYDFEKVTGFREKLPEITDIIIEGCYDEASYTHIDDESIPSNESVITIINTFRKILYPGYFNKEKINSINLKYDTGRLISRLFDLLTEQIVRNVHHDCRKYNQPCSECVARAQRIALDMIESIPEVRRILATDVRATYDGDPAAKSCDEIIFSYPGIYAITVYRIAHKLFEHDVPLLPRIMTEHAHSRTGIDIHPGAEIGERFVIDHGTGVVIGETTVIGRNVRIYQGVTLGALSIPKGSGDSLRGTRRHPTIEDDVIIYSGATILGRKAVIGARSVIGGNVWITEAIPPDTRVIMESPKLIYK